MILKYNIYPKGNLLLLLIFSFLISCGTSNKIPLKNFQMQNKVSEFKIVGIPFIPPVLVKKDTIPQKKKMSKEEFNTYLLQQYKTNYNNLFAHEFKKLTDENSQLEKEIQTLTLSNQERSIRARKKRDSLEDIAEYYEIQALNAKNELVKNSAKQTQQYSDYLNINNETIKKINSITNFLVLVVVIIFLILFCVFVYVVRLSTKVKNIQNYLSK